jgi:hypothetical protein
MTSGPFRTMLVDVEREIDGLEERRNDLDRAIARLRRIAEWLRHRNRSRRSTAKAKSISQSLTNHCRAVLRMSGRKGLTPREVKRLLTEGGFGWERFGNPMAAIHTVLKRLVHQQEAVTLIDGLGERRFAVKHGTVIALKRQDIEDKTFIQELLEAESPEDIVELVKQRRSD